MSSAAAAPHKLQNYINGNFVDPIEGLWVDSFDPSTATVNAHVADSGAEDVENAVQAALAAFPEWSSYPVQKRADFINKLADLLESHIDEFALAESIDQGKTFLHAKNIEIPRAVYNFRFFAGAILHNDSTSTVMTGALEAVNIVVTQPVGVAGLISPWNLPLYLLTWKIAPAIAAGNTVVAKPSEFTSVTAWMFCRLVTEAGFPPGVINMVFGTGPRAGSALVKHPRVPLISFTGGTATGAIIQRDVASHCKKLSLELGGKNPNIIFADCNLDEAVATTIRSSFLNQGEICLCGSRIFVERSIYDTFLERFVAATKQLKVGDPRDPSTTTGALVSKPHYEKVLQYIQLAREEGGKIETGGDKPELVAPFDQGYFVNPTIITGLEPYHCRVQQEEIFGPVVTVWPFDTESEVVDYANSVKYGLSASLWTSNAERAMRISLKIHTGTVWVNCWMLRDLRIPFGGSKQSGIGREGGHHSLEFFTDTKTICLKFSSQLQ